MRLAFILTLFLALLPAMNSGANAQDLGAEQSLDQLRFQLIDVQAKEAELKDSLRQLDENLKPENIERSLAGIGSTKPEELREQRRRQLSIERERVSDELQLVITSRERLETAIRAAERAVYERSASEPALPTGQTLQAQKGIAWPWWIAMAGGLVVLLGIGLIIAAVSKRRDDVFPH